MNRPSVACLAMMTAPMAASTNPSKTNKKTMKPALSRRLVCFTRREVQKRNHRRGAHICHRQPVHPYRTQPNAGDALRRSPSLSGSSREFMSEPNRSRAQSAHGMNGRRYRSHHGHLVLRGTSHQLRQKYEEMAREARRTGDTVTEQSCLQSAEHYLRLKYAG